MPQRFAAIDIGSNSTLLLILELGEDNVARVLVDTKRSTRLSSGVHKSGQIEADGLQRQFNALDELQEILNLHQVDRVVACGTEVFRVASNAAELSSEIRCRYKWRFEIISGEKEAHLSYRSACTGIEGIRDERSVLDVGGGSTEIILGMDNRVLHETSLRMGAVNLSERFHLDRPCSEDTLSAAADFIIDAAKDIPQPIRDRWFAQPKLDLVAVGGTAVTLAAIFKKQKSFVPNEIHGVKLSIEWISQQIRAISSLSIADRQTLMPFDPDRAGIIVGGALIISNLCREAGVQELTVSNRGLRWGLILDSFEELENAQIEQ